MKRSIITLCAGLLFGAGLGVSAAQAAISDYVGSYESITYSADTIGGELIPVGRISFTIAKTSTATATASGTLTLRDKKTASLKTTFTEVNGKAVSAGPLTLLKTSTKPQTPLVTLTAIEVSPSGSFTVSGADIRPNVGSVYAVVSEGVRLQAFTGTKTSISPWEGIYTAAFTPAEGTSSAGTPAGAGYASLIAAKNGKLNYTGKLGDGTALTGSALPDANGVYRIFTPTYTFGGFFQADINLATIGAQSSLALWNKPANDKDKKYKAGFATALDVRVAEWLRPAAKQVPGVVLGFGVSKNFEVAFSGDGLDDANYLPYLPDTARFVVGRVQAVSGGAGSPVANNNAAWNGLWKNVNINAGTGVFSGKQVLKHTVVDSKGKSKVVTREIPVEGVLLLDATLSSAPFALGQYRVTPIAAGSTEITGEVSFRGPLEDNTSVASAGSYSMKVRHLLWLDMVNGVPLAAKDRVLPPKAPKDAAVIAFTITDDLQKITFNGRTVSLLSSDIIHLVYSNAAASPMDNLTITVTKNATTGAITHVSASYNRQVFDMKTFKMRQQSLTLDTADPAATYLIKK